MSSTLEELRQTHEDVEILRHLASCALQSRTSAPTAHPRLAAYPLPTPRAAEQLTSDLIRLASERSTVLSEAYDSADTLPTIADDLDASDAMSLFYSRLRDLREAHRTAEGVGAAEGTERDGVLVREARRDVLFSGEEGDGKYLDLMQFYSQYLNLRKGDNVEKVEYYQYVRAAVTEFEELSIALRRSQSFARYLQSLLDYLISFAERAHPLDRVAEHVEKARGSVKSNISNRLKELISKYDNANSLLEGLGAEGIKQELLVLGQKCGGRPIDRAARLLKVAKEGKYGERPVVEGLILFMLNELLAEERAATVANVQKKLSLSYVEIEAERVTDEAVAQGAVEVAKRDDEEEIESTVYNPKDVPLGWDGKPIPYWMYKLHGLNHEFKCEICGNTTYRGPRAFERHFTETQHVQGLRCLGIGYSKAFMMITKIADAIALHEKLKRAHVEATFDEESQMEFEDAEGNVLNKKTYTDLLKQGLL